MIKYKARISNYAFINDIDAVECERETESSVFINGRRNLKRSSYDNFYDTWGEAHAALLANAQRLVEQRRKDMARSEASLLAIQAMVKPDGAV
jgi:hypothetical protein